MTTFKQGTKTVQITDDNISVYDSTKRMAQESLNHLRTHIFRMYEELEVIHEHNLELLRENIALMNENVNLRKQLNDNKRTATN